MWYKCKIRGQVLELLFEGPPDGVSNVVRENLIKVYACYGLGTVTSKGKEVPAKVADIEWNEVGETIDRSKLTLQFRRQNIDYYTARLQMAGLKQVGEAKPLRGCIHVGKED